MAEAQSLEPDASSALEAHAKLALEWSVLLEALAERTASGPGQASLLALEPATNPSEAHARSARVRSALTLSEHGAELPRANFPDIRDTLGRIRLKAQVSGTELVDVRKVLEQSSALRDLVQAHAEFQPELATWLSSDAKLNYLARSLAEALERDGSVSDAASPSLVAARQRVREAREELKRRLNNLSQRYADVLSGAYYTERDGRYVLPVRSDAHYKVEGIVLGSSGSGSTLFVEPSELIALGNRLRVREAEVERETARILGELAAQVAERLDSVSHAFDVCVQADVIAALTQFAVEAGAQALDMGTEPRFDLRGMRHPLLALNSENVVANDVQLRAGQALVVSGPNAGGKTVVLKCLGLFAWMARAGVPIPTALDSYVGWFDYVLADVGDEQSIVRSLSTFSAHVQHLANILSCARRHVLVLLDEVAAGTDPEEGAALAAAVLETLSARGAAVAVTTHYERLKELAAEAGPLENASVGFDFARMAPTFLLTQGIPGASSALQVAARHGLPKALLTRASELLPHVAHERERLVLELSEEKARLLAERTEFEQERKREADAHAAREADARAAAEHERVEFERDARQLQKEVQLARAELLRVRDRLKAERVTAPELKSIEQQVNQIAAGVALGGRLAPRVATAVAAPPVVAPDLTPGSRVRLRATGAIATVLETPQRGEVLVRVGGMRLRQKLSDLQVAPPAGKERAAPKTRTSAQATPRPAAQRTGANTLDLRGVRVEDAAMMLDGFVDRLMGVGETAGFVLHGHGTGALRTAVREHLRLSSYVEQSKAADPEDGGEALTVFLLR